MLKRRTKKCHVCRGRKIHKIKVRAANGEKFIAKRVCEYCGGVGRVPRNK